MKAPSQTDLERRLAAALAERDAAYRSIALICERTRALPDPTAIELIQDILHPEDRSDVVPPWPSTDRERLRDKVDSLQVHCLAVISNSGDDVAALKTDVEIVMDACAHVLVELGRQTRRRGPADPGAFRPH
jgi:hypothetical protein